MRKALLLGESWTTHSIHQKGFDSFTTTEYTEGGQEFRAAVEGHGWAVDHIPAHAIGTHFPQSPSELAAYDVVVISDVGANTFLLSRAVFSESRSEPNRLGLLRDYVLAGGGLLMVGGYLSFAGIDGKADYAKSPLADILPVDMSTTDDRAERPQGVTPRVLEPDHPALGGVGTDWPALLGYNRTTSRSTATVLVEVDGRPLVAVREVHAGRTAVFTSDMSPHWAPPSFMRWAGYATLWSALLDWTASARREASAALPSDAGPGAPDPTLPDLEDFGAWVDHGRIEVRGSDRGPLAGMTFAVKDSFDVAGVPTGNGSPTWLAGQSPAVAHSPAVQRVLDSGAVLIGKTHMDEFGYSISGVNAHYPVPINPAAPERIPGGSSSGSVVAVAGGLVPFALAADAGGSVRVPASYCGVLGIRPTFGRVADPGMAGSSFGTVGWFARDADLFALLGSLLLDGYAPPSAPTRLLLAGDLLATADPATQEAFRTGLGHVEAVLGEAAAVSVAEGRIDAWRRTFRVTQGAEIAQGWGAWAATTEPHLGPDIAGRLKMARSFTGPQIESACEHRVAIRWRLDELLAGGAVLALPTTPGPAPLRSSTWRELDAWRERALNLLCPSGLAGLPQVSLPLAQVDGSPVGLSLVAARGNDETLLDIARQVMPSAAGSSAAPSAVGRRQG